MGQPKFGPLHSMPNIEFKIIFFLYLLYFTTSLITDYKYTQATINGLQEMHPVILLLLSSITTDWVWLLIFRSHTTTRHSRQDSSERVISSSQRPLPDNTQQSQQTNIHGPRRAEDFYLPLKIRRLRPGLNPRTWVPKASTLPLDHRNLAYMFHYITLSLSGIFIIQVICKLLTRRIDLRTVFPIKMFFFFQK